MYSFSIPLFLAIKHRIFVFRSHFLLCRHLLLPPRQILRVPQALSLERVIDRCYNTVDKP